jgi:hypothetical protein
MFTKGPGIDDLERKLDTLYHLEDTLPNEELTSILRGTIIRNSLLAGTAYGTLLESGVALESMGEHEKIMAMEGIMQAIADTAKKAANKVVDWIASGIAKLITSFKKATETVGTFLKPAIDALARVKGKIDEKIDGTGHGTAIRVIGSIVALTAVVGTTLAMTKTEYANGNMLQKVLYDLRDKLRNIKFPGRKVNVDVKVQGTETVFTGTIEVDGGDGVFKEVGTPSALGWNKETLTKVFTDFKSKLGELLKKVGGFLAGNSFVTNLTKRFTMASIAASRIENDFRQKLWRRVAAKLIRKSLGFALKAVLVICAAAIGFMAGAFAMLVKNIHKVTRRKLKKQAEEAGQKAA